LQILVGVKGEKSQRGGKGVLKRGKLTVPGMEKRKRVKDLGGNMQTNHKSNGFGETGHCLEGGARKLCQEKGNR